MGRIQRGFPVLTNSHLLKALNDFPKKNYIIVFYLPGPVLDLYLVRLTVVPKRVSFFKKVKAFAWFSSLFPIFCHFLYVLSFRCPFHENHTFASNFYNRFCLLKFLLITARHEKLVFKLLILMICWSLRVRGSTVYPSATFHV